MNQNHKYLGILSLNLSVAIALGAVGAHALKSRLTPKLLETFLTGNRYHFYITFSLFILWLIQNQLSQKPNLKVSNILCWFALFTFTLGCYLYAITEVKFFVHIVPFGGFAFIIAWIVAGVKLIRLPSQ